MDAAQLTQLFFVVGVMYGFGRFVFGSLSRAEAGFASLWVPPDQNLGWPHGVQESDEPWGWRPARTAAEEFAPPNLAPMEPQPSTPIDWTIPRAGSFVIPVAPVAPVRFELRAH